jgi:Zn-finger nucleic acid-binding protein
VGEGRRRILMRCPRCGADLKTEDYKGIEVDRCAGCQGLWLDYSELDQLEDVALDEDEVKATLIYSGRKGELSCPKCAGPMKAFSYRGWNLELDLCEEEHGFWLDHGEEERVLELMEQRIKDLDRKASAEKQWADFLGKVKSKSFFSRLKGLFK